MMADVYDATATYAYGDYCIYQNDFYKCTTAITTAEAWNSGHWTKITLSAASLEDDFEVATVQYGSTLTAAQIEKLKHNKLLIKYGTNILVSKDFDANNNYLALESISFSAANGTNVPKYLTKSTANVGIYLDTGIVTVGGTSTDLAISNNNDNFFATTIEPATLGKKLVREQNLRKTQDMFDANYNAASTYAVGDYAVYQNNLYKCISNIPTAEEWNENH